MAFELFPSSVAPGDCGTFLATGGTLYAPDFANHGGSATGNLGSNTPFTPVSQSAVTGSGTSSDPFQVVTVAKAGTTGLELTETDSYVVGDETYRTDVAVSNAGRSPQSIILYRAGDCFLAGSDSGTGIQTGNSIGCQETEGSRIEEWVPITAGSHHVEAFFSTVWGDIGAQTAFPDTCDCAIAEDNGAGLSWSATVPPSGSRTFSNVATFSPTGKLSLTTSKTADAGTVAPGGQDGYTITITNPNAGTVIVDVHRHAPGRVQLCPRTDHRGDDGRSHDLRPGPVVVRLPCPGCREQRDHVAALPGHRGDHARGLLRRRGRDGRRGLLGRAERADRQGHGAASVDGHAHGHHPRGERQRRLGDGGPVDHARAVGWDRRRESLPGLGVPGCPEHPVPGHVRGFRIRWPRRIHDHLQRRM